MILGSSLHQQQKVKKKRGPAYERRQAKRRAARENAEKAGNYAQETEQVSDEVFSDENVEENGVTYKCDMQFF